MSDVDPWEALATVRQAKREFHLATYGGGFNPYSDEDDDQENFYYETLDTLDREELAIIRKIQTQALAAYKDAATSEFKALLVGLEDLKKDLDRYKKNANAASRFLKTLGKVAGWLLEAVS